MAGRITKSEEQLKPDPKHGDKVLAKFINCFMKDGKKAVAQRVMYDALDQIETRLKKEKDRTDKQHAVNDSTRCQHSGERLHPRVGDELRNRRRKHNDGRGKYRRDNPRSIHFER